MDVTSYTLAYEKIHVQNYNTLEDNNFQRHRCENFRLHEINKYILFQALQSSSLFGNPQISVQTANIKTFLRGKQQNGKFRTTPKTSYFC